MARTMFVNPSFVNPRKRRGKKSRRRSGRGRRHHARRSHGIRRYRRRNAGIAPFMSNPLILSNPRKRSRARRRNPMSLPSVSSMLDSTLSHFGGAALALTLTTIGTSKIGNVWARRGAQFAGAVVGGSLVGNQSAKMGGAFAGAMMYPLLQDLASDLLGVGVGAGVAAKEADLDALAADLEDVMDDMDDDDEGLSDDDMEYAW